MKNRDVIFLYFVLLIGAFNFAMCGDKVYHFIILERFEIKGGQNDAMSQYVYIKHNTTWKLLCATFTLRSLV